MSGREFDFIRWIRERTPNRPGVLVGPGDDTAVLAPPAAPLLITTDLLTEGVDFVLAVAGPFQVGRKAMAVNLSDITAMAGKPTAAVVGVVLPKWQPNQTLAEELYRGLQSQAAEFDVAIVGGDTNSWEGELVISVTLLGEATGRGAVLRSGARCGDWIFVTGPLGGSILGRHLEPRPRVREAQMLHQLVEIHAMIDISDGLSADLHHILTESECGAELDARQIPIHPDAETLSAQTGRPGVEHALTDGEDFELIFAVSPEDGAKLLVEQPIPGLKLAHIGTCVPEGFWRIETGERRPLTPRGWVHTFS
jgi:thiamine-monophosphate kinase